jgi:hypothetical protein
MKPEDESIADITLASLLNDFEPKNGSEATRTGTLPLPKTLITRARNT